MARFLEEAAGRLGVAGVGGLVREVSAGVMSSLVTLTYCLSFSALLFAGPLEGSLAWGLWSFLVATVIVTLIAGAATTLPPLLAGPRNPAVAVMSVLAATVSAAALAKGLTSAEAARHVLVALACATLLTGFALWALGAFRLGQVVRFVPYPVVAGFLAASGWLLIVGGLKVSSGLTTGFPDALLSLDAGAAARVAVALGIASVLIGLKGTAVGAAALPLALVGAVVGLKAWLLLVGGHEAWFLSMQGTTAPWSPLASLGGIDWMIVGSAGVEIVSIAAVSVVALLLDITSLEVQRRKSADMDAEFRVVGGANLAVLAVGGVVVAHSLAPSRLVDALGGRTRVASVAAGLALGLVLASGVNVAALVPRPVLGGMLIFLGLGLVVEALKAPGRRSWLELVLSLAIVVAIVWLGYLMGILLGLIGACLLFAASYSRIGVVRRHVTRAAFAAPVERAPEVLERLAAEGERIHVLWLAGFVFFGSSNGLYEEIRRVVGAGGGRGRRWVVLDCARVTGIDASAVLSFQKLANWAEACDVVLVMAGLSERVEADLAAAGMILPAGRVPVLATRSEALEWCEDQLIAEKGDVRRADEPAAFQSWLAAELGDEGAQRLVEGYLERRAMATGEVVCALGAPSDTIELVASGSVAVMVAGLGDRAIRVRRMTGRTVVGEMGFFRGVPRAASVMAEEPAVVYTMTHDAYRRLITAEPALGARFLEFVIRALANRVEVANREIAALI